MNAYDLLKEDHETVAEILEQLVSTTEQAGKAREALFAKLNSDLSIHSAIEEKIFYPALRDADETRELVVEALEEHQAVKELLAELDSMPKNTEEWTEKLEVLKESVEQHVDEEEGELFEEARKVLTDEEAEDLGERLQAAKGAMAAKAQSSR